MLSSKKLSYMKKSVWNIIIEFHEIKCGSQPLV
jgi:hypothetical protein